MSDADHKTVVFRAPRLLAVKEVATNAIERGQRVTPVDRRVVVFHIATRLKLMRAGGEIGARHLLACDVLAPMQYRRPNLSENVLKAIAARRPVVTNNFGYSHMIVTRFNAGWSCACCAAAIACPSSPGTNASPQPTTR